MTPAEIAELARRLGMSDADLVEALRRRQAALVAYQTGLAGSRLNRAGWPATVVAAVETAEQAMRQAVGR